MTRTIEIGGAPVTFRSSAALPIKYREYTGREFYTDMQRMSDSVDRAADMAYVMFRCANPESTISEAEWLDGYELMDFNDILPELVEMLTLETATTAESKKKNGQ